MRSRAALMAQPAPALPFTLYDTGFSLSVLAVGRGGQAGPAMSPASEGWLESEGKRGRGQHSPKCTASLRRELP